MNRALLVLLTLGLASNAAAAEPTTTLDTERFRPSSGLDGGVLVDGAGVGAPWQVDMAFWLHGQRRPITFVVDGAPRDSSIGFRIGARLGAGLNFGRVARLAVDLPIGLYQEGVDPVTGADLPRGGVGDLRLSPQVTLLDPARKPLGISILVPITFPTGRAPAFLGEGRVTAEPRIVLEHRIDRGAARRFALSGSGGFHLRPRTIVLDLDSSWEVTAGLSFRWLPVDRVVIGTELAGAFGRGANARHGEWNTFAGLRFGPREGFELVAGGAVGLGRGVGTPEGRLYAAFRARVGAAAHKQRVADVAPTKRKESAEEVAFRSVRAGERADGVERVADSAPNSSAAGPVATQADGVQTARAEPLIRVVSDEKPSYEALRGSGPPIPGRGARWETPMVTRPAAGAPAQLGAEVLFDTGSAALRADGAATIRQIARWLMHHDSDGGVLVEGHADPRGSHPTNDDLSKRRAEAVQRALVQEGLGTDRIEVRWHGERKQRRATGGQEAVLQANRRAVFTIRLDAG